MGGLRLPRDQAWRVCAPRRSPGHRRGDAALARTPGSEKYAATGSAGPRRHHRADGLPPARSARVLGRGRGRAATLEAGPLVPNARRGRDAPTLTTGRDTGAR